jgi:hypothetical protein
MHSTNHSNLKGRGGSLEAIRVAVVQYNITVYEESQNYLLVLGRIRNCSNRIFQLQEARLGLDPCHDLHQWLPTGNTHCFKP